MTRMKFVLCCVSILSLAGTGSLGFAQEDTVEWEAAETVPVRVESSSETYSAPSDKPRTTSEPKPPIPGTYVEPNDDLPRANRKSGGGNRRPRIVTKHTQEMVYDAIPAEEIEEAAKFKAAIQALKDAKGDDAKQEATHTIYQLLQRQFERDLKRREDELAPIEQRIKALRQQLDKRKEAMNDIISLRVKTILSNAEGLGFPDDDGLFEVSAAEFSTGNVPVKKDGSNSSSSARRRREITKPAKPADEDSEFKRPRQ